MFTANLLIKFSIMLKNILNLNGAQELSKNEQGAIHGSGPLTQTCGSCGSGCLPTETCVQIFCGPGGPWDSTVSGHVCVSDINHK